MILMFAGGNRTIMAADTGSRGYIAVVHTGGIPTNHRMAIITRRSGRNMVIWFRCRDNTVVTALTGPGHPTVVHFGRLPTTWCMAIVTRGVGLEMFYRLCVTSGAGIGQIIMVHPAASDSPSHGAVAVVTHRLGVYMVYGLLMTRGTDTHHSGMVHRVGIPGKGRVAVITVLRSLDMVIAHARGGATIVAGATLLWSALKNTTLVTGFTFCSRMSSA